MIRKFSVTHTNSTSTQRQQSIDSTTAPSIETRQVASPSSHLESVDSSIPTADHEKTQKLYAQSLESTENSDYPIVTASTLSKADALQYPLGSEDYETSTDGM